jgi:hypothetical protein
MSSCLATTSSLTRYKYLITIMKLKHLYVYFVQETWLEGDVFDEIINGYHVFCQKQLPRLSQLPQGCNHPIATLPQRV